MVQFILAILVILWLLGFISAPWLAIPNIVLFTIAAHAVTLRELIIFLLVIWAIGILPSPLRQIAAILFILWVLSLLGIFAIGGVGLTNLLLLAIIVGIAFSLF